MIHRRAFLKASVSTGLVAWGLTAPRFLARTAAALPALDNSGDRDSILVVVQLTGGNDGLNTVIPFKDPLYAKYRPTLKIAPKDVRKLTDDVGLHPGLAALAELFERNELCVVQGVGYPNPDQSHFRSMDIWQGGSTAEHIAEGWLGKALSRMKAGGQGFHCASGNEEAPLALVGPGVKVPSLTRIEDYQLKVLASSGQDRARQKQIIEEAARLEGGQGDLLDFVKRTAVNTYASSKRLQEIAKAYEPKVPYPPTGLAERLKLAAQLIDADLGARVFYVAIDGFDTHANQAAAHGNLLTEVSEAMSAFYRDLSARGHKDRVLMMTFSEFGRRARENGSQGTDHGSAAPMFLVGAKVKAGVVGKHPSLEKLEDGNLAHHTDFRGVYAAVLDHWLGVRHQDVLGKTYDPAPVF
jgi:uncharacterized protein (DUF1501 family)